MEEEEQGDSGDPEFIKRQEQKRSELDEQLREYIAEWRLIRVKEHLELKKLKEKQAKRKVARADEEKAAAERKKQEEERRVKEIEEKKIREAEQKKQRLIDAEKKRQAMMAALKEQHKNKTMNFVVRKKALAASLTDAELERTKTKEQLEEEKKIALSIRIKPLVLDGLSMDQLKEKATELWDAIVKLETEKYDLEERMKRQEYDLKELKERQRQQLRHRALKKGLDPEALTGPHPPKIQLASKYERRVDIRSFDERQKLFQGGFDSLYLEQMEKGWNDKMHEFMERPRKRLPRWFGERPGKKPGDPDTPEGEEELAKADDIEVEDTIIPEKPKEEIEEEDLEEEEVEVDEEEEDDDDEEDEE
ncbi:troponin T-like [Anthonomus grandis grandis]|uniref:troponin T-like n=1 Tax=Anthonomus grandis grandis TaxID=2921223 RepID=UPI002165AAD3|nr:troponin T-like [Anthonomus grandis grandis]